MPSTYVVGGAFLLGVQSDYKMAMAVQGDDLTDHFIRVMTQMAVTHSLSQEAQATSAGRPTSLNYLVLDAYVRLVCMLIRGEALTACTKHCLHVTPLWA